MWNIYFSRIYRASHISIIQKESYRQTLEKTKNNGERENGGSINN